jgi:general secretion pathway protein N
MKQRVILIIVTAAMLIGLVTFPLRFALTLGGADDAGLTARGVTGTIWSGRVHDAVWHGASLGSIDMGLAPLALLRGEARMNFARDDALRGKLDGAAILSGDRGIDGVTGAVSLGASLAGVPLDTLRLTGVGARFDGDGRCVTAGGTVQLALALPVPGLDLANGLSGPLTCRDGRAQAQLASQSGMERLTVDVDGSGVWKARLAIGSGNDPALAALLRAAGFLPVDNALVLMRQGRL